MKNIESILNGTKGKGEDRKRFSLAMLIKSVTAIIILLIVATGCDTTSSKSTFEIEKFLGNYSGSVEASFAAPGQQAQKQNHQGEIRIQDLSGGQARMNVMFEGGSLLVFQGAYDENGWSLSASGINNFNLSVDIDGNIEGSLNRQDITITVEGKITGDSCNLNIVQNYLQDSSTFRAGTELGFDYNVSR